MYKAIAERRSVRKLYVEALVKRGELTVEEAEGALADFQNKLQVALDQTRATRPGGRQGAEAAEAASACCRTSPTGVDRGRARRDLRPPHRLPARLHAAPEAGPPVRDPGQAVPRAAARSSGPPPRRWRSARWCSRARPCAWPARTAAGARSASATPRWSTTRTRTTGSRCNTLARRHGPVLGVRQPAQRVRRARLRVRLRPRQPRRAGDVGGAVRRLHQRRADHHRPVPRGRRGQVGPDATASSCCCRTATRARARSTRRRASSGSSRCAPRTTSRCATPRRRRSTSTCCGARCAATCASRWSCSPRRRRCA